MSTTPQDRLYDKLLDVADAYCSSMGWPPSKASLIADAMHNSAVYAASQIQEQIARQKVLPL